VETHPPFLASPSKRCRNAVSPGSCNWLISFDDASELCVACRTTRTIPDLQRQDNLLLWVRMEHWEQRLIYTLLDLGLLSASGRAGAPGLRFGSWKISGGTRTPQRSRLPFLHRLVEDRRGTTRALDLATPGRLPCGSSCLGHGILVIGISAKGEHIRTKATATTSRRQPSTNDGADLARPSPSVARVR
jgi:hypothetical protein